MEHRRALGSIRRRSPALTDDQIARVMRYCGGHTPVSRDRTIGILIVQPRTPYRRRTLGGGYVALSAPSTCRSRSPASRSDAFTSYASSTPHAAMIWWPWADVTTIVAIGEFNPADCVAKRSIVEATLKELWGKAGIVVPDFHYFKLKAHEAGDATLTTTAVADWIDKSFFLAQPSLKYILRYVADRLSYTVRCPAPLHEFGRCTKLYQAEVKFVGQIPERRNFSVMGTIENRPYLAILTALLQTLLYLETHEGADIVDVNRAQYLSAVSRLDD
ncbi:hypothetical protein ACP4OV_009097 [Aristida adscensionis]